MRCAETSVEAQVRGLLEAAALFRALAQGFAYPAPGHAEAMRAALARIRAAEGYEARPARLRQALAAARGAWHETDDAALAAEYMRLFLGSGLCSLHETAYGDGRRIAGRAVELADIGGFYGAFGFEVSETDPDLPDHLCTEVELLSLLLVKQAYALSSRWPARRRIASDAAAAFLKEHLGRWIGALHLGLQEHGAAAPYRALVVLLDVAVTMECARLRVAPTAVQGCLPHDAMQDDAFTCPREAEVA